jgi:hypothetical protein
MMRALYQFVLWAWRRKARHVPKRPATAQPVGQAMDLKSITGGPIPRMGVLTDAELDALRNWPPAAKLPYQKPTITPIGNVKDLLGQVGPSGLTGAAGPAGAGFPPGFTH